LLLHITYLNSSVQIKPWVLFIGDLKEETNLERQIVEVVLFVSSSCTKDFGKLMDKLIIHILFLATLELNIIDKGKENRMQFMCDDKSIQR
jgi:hypothetical protein